MRVLWQKYVLRCLHKPVRRDVMGIILVVESKESETYFISLENKYAIQNIT